MHKALAFFDLLITTFEYIQDDLLPNLKTGPVNARLINAKTVIFEYTGGNIDFIRNNRKSPLLVCSASEVG